MNPNEFHQMYKYLVRPSREKVVVAAKKELGIPKNAKINNGSEILDWINFNQKMYGNNKMPLTPEEKRIGESIEKKITEVPHDTDPGYIEPKEMEDIKKSLPVSEMVKKPKKKKESSWKYTSWADGQKDIEEMKIKDKAKEKIIKKTLIVEKPKTKPVPISPLPYDWREGIWHDLEDEDPYYNWQPKPSEDVRKILNIKNKEAAEGIKSILRLHRRLT